MARRLRRLAASVLSLSILALSLGLDAQRAFAQALTGRPVAVTPSISAPIVPATVAPLSGAPALLSAAPALTAPILGAVAVPAPAAAPRAAAAAPALAAPAAASARVSASVAAAAPALQALAKPETGAAASASAGRSLEAALTGVDQASSASSEVSAPAVASARFARLSARSAASKDTSKPEVPSAAAPAGIDSASTYNAARARLASLAEATGSVYTLPQAGAKLTDSLIERAASRRVVLSDYDDTLAGYNEVLPQDMIDAIKAIRAAGKEFAVISDRGDEKRPGSTQLTVFESLESIPAADRAGMLVAANNGGRVYRYDAQGVPQKVFEVPSLEQDAAKGDAVRGAAAATKARLSEAGVEQHPGDSKNPAESYNTYGYALMIKAGATEAQVKHAAKIMEEELAKRGFSIEVNPRMPKDPANPPYVTFSIIDKSYAAAWIAKALGASKDEVLTIGDNYYKPREGRASAEQRAEAETLSGRALGVIGNETDRNMEKGVPGALSLSVGGTADPRMADGWVLAGKGPSVTRRVLGAVASGPKSAPKSSGLETLGGIALIGGIVALGAAGWYALGQALADIVAAAEAALRGWVPGSEDYFFGGALMGVAGMLGMGPSRLLSHPADSYENALKAAVEAAKSRGLGAEAVRFVEATASTPVRDGRQWNYTFALTRADGKTDLAYVEFDNFLGGAPGFRSRVYEGAAPAEGLAPVALTPIEFRAETGLGAEYAMTQIGAHLREFGSAASVSLAARREHGGRSLSYRFYDDHGSVATVTGTLASVTVDALSPKALKARAAALEKESARRVAAEGVTRAEAPNALYALAVERILAKAAEIGAPSERVSFVSAVHSQRAFGDEWRFHFAVAGLPYSVPARRTTVSETMMDAFEPEAGSLPRFGSASEGLPLSLFDGLVTVEPAAALAAAKATGRAVERLALIRRGESLAYSAQGRGGDEIISMDARTGEVRPGDAPRSGSGWKGVLVGLALAALVAAIYGALAWAFMNAPVAPGPVMPDGTPIPNIDGGWEKLFGSLAGGVLFGMMRGGSRMVLPDAARSYGDALAQARRVAQDRGADPASVRFLQATAVLPAVEDRRWSYVFSFPAPGGATTLVYADASLDAAGAGVEWRLSVHSPAVSPEVEAVSPTLVPGALRVAAESAHQIALRDHPSIGARASVSLNLRRDARTGDADLWYSFYGEEGSEVRVNARTGESLLARAPSGASARENAELLTGLGWAAAASTLIAALLAAAYALLGL